MWNAGSLSREQIREFLKSSQGIEFAGCGRNEKYPWVEGDFIALPGLLHRRMDLRRKILSTGHTVEEAVKWFHMFAPYLSRKSRKL